ncbi:MAG: FecR domain-containing protein [Deltaproteobacteria bacterium]|nr:FecR domain-containing protein [Deltaproteobacteria bacterium]
MKTNHRDYYADFTDKMSDTASAWAAKLKAGTISRKEKARLDDWLSEKSAHKATFDRMNAVWDEFGEFKDHPLVAGELDKIKHPAWMGGFRRFFRLNSGSPFMRPLAAAATIVLVVAAAWMMQTNDHSPETAPAPPAYHSKIGEQKTVLLADGSTAILDTNTSLSIQYSETTRNAELITGSALFSVVHDSDRPFTVIANNTQVQVLGTEFNVSMRNGHKVIVEVLQGSVQVSRRAESDMPAIAEKTKKDRPSKRNGYAQVPVVKEKKLYLARTITAGQSMVVDENKHVYQVKQVKAADIKRISAWREGKLDFDSAPLADVIDQINRYVDKKIVFGDDTLKPIRISVILKIRDSKHFLTSLEELFPIDARPSAQNTIILTRREDTINSQ